MFVWRCLNRRARPYRKWKGFIQINRLEEIQRCMFVAHSLTLFHRPNSWLSISQIRGFPWMERGVGWKFYHPLLHLFFHFFLFSKILISNPFPAKHLVAAVGRGLPVVANAAFEFELV